MLVLDDAVVSKLAALPTPANDRHFLLEIDERLEDRLVAVEGLEGNLDVGGRFYLCLTLAVIAETGRLQDRGHADLANRTIEFVENADPTERRHGKSVFRKKGFFS